MKTPVYLTFFSQKGGVGKTTFNVIAASYLHYVLKKRVILIDCDFPQFSIDAMRKRDAEHVQKDAYLKNLAYKQFSTLGVAAYPVLSSTVENALSMVSDYIKKHALDCDAVILDLTGTVSNTEILKVISMLNYIFIPIVADRVVLSSSVNFANVIDKNLIQPHQSEIKAMRLFWNLYDAREKNHLYEAFATIIKDFGLGMLDTYIPDRKNFRKEISDRKTIFRSTLFPPSRGLMTDNNLDQFFAEIMNIIDWN